MQQASWQQHALREGWRDLLQVLLRKELWTQGISNLLTIEFSSSSCWPTFLACTVQGLWDNLYIKYISSIIFNSWHLFIQLPWLLSALPRYRIKLLTECFWSLKLYFCTVEAVRSKCKGNKVNWSEPTLCRTIKLD